MVTLPESCRYTFGGAQNPHDMARTGDTVKFTTGKPDTAGWDCFLAAPCITPSPPRLLPSRLALKKTTTLSQPPARKQKKTLKKASGIVVAALAPSSSVSRSLQNPRSRRPPQLEVSVFTCSSSQWLRLDLASTKWLAIQTKRLITSSLKEFAQAVGGWG